MQDLNATFMQNQIGVDNEKEAEKQSATLLTPDELVERLKDLSSVWAIANTEEKRCIVLDIVNRIVVYKDGTVNMEIQ
jgi:hypothetical protein